MSGISLKPVGDHFILVPDSAEEQTEGGILLPSSSQEAPKTGKVIAVGDGQYNMLRGEFIGMRVKPGDHIIYRPFSGLDITLEDGEGKANAKLLKSEDIMAIIGSQPNG
jgi:chaperonin GroES